MKKLFGLLPVLLVILLTAGCQKSTPVNLTEINAHVIDGGDPAADGLGLYINIDNVLLGGNWVGMLILVTHVVVHPFRLIL